LEPIRLSSLLWTEIAEPTEKCLEREKLLSQWTSNTRRLTKILEEQHTSIMKGDHRAFAGFEEQIRLARNSEAEACRKYFGHVNTHGCV
jgi:hypothetical protein